MALIKSKEQSTGVTVSYWKIAGLELLGDFCRATVMGYIDKAARDANKSSVEAVTYDLIGFTIAELDEANKNPYSIAYNKLKSDVVFFSDATDDL